MRSELKNSNFQKMNEPNSGNTQIFLNNLIELTNKIKEMKCQTMHVKAPHRYVTIPSTENQLKCKIK